MIYLNCVFEDAPSFAVMQKMLGQYKDRISINQQINAHGYGKILKHINAYNKAAAHIPFFIITDLDAGECAPSLIDKWFNGGSPHPNMLFRVAVREIEAWLMADRENFAKYIGIRQDLIPPQPDKIQDPKSTLFSLIKKSRDRQLHADMLPKDSSASIGPYYNARLRDFVKDRWNMQTAMDNSHSLKKAHLALQKFVANITETKCRADCGL